MKTKQIHYLSGLVVTSFVAIHLINHCFSIFGTDEHIKVMMNLRQFYRNIVIESIFLTAVGVQIYSGIKLYRSKKKSAKTFFELMHIWTGLYLAFFFVVHLSAVLSGRLLLNLDTTIYFGAAGLNAFPANLFFIPYYMLAVASFFGHVAAIHQQKMTKKIVGISPTTQSLIILVAGICFSLFLIYSLTNQFKGFKIPEAYSILIGK